MAVAVAVAVDFAEFVASSTWRICSAWSGFSTRGRCGDVGLLDSAAALLHSIARNHALVDGNKRLAWLASIILLDLNGQAPDLSHDDAFDLVMGVADGTCDVEQIADRLHGTRAISAR